MENGNESTEICGTGIAKKSDCAGDQLRDQAISEYYAGRRTAYLGALDALMKNMTQALNEVLVQGSYYADAGWGSTHVTGAQMTLTVTGDVKPGDAACDYILSDEVMYRFGAARQSHLKLVKGGENHYLARYPGQYHTSLWGCQPGQCADSDYSWKRETSHWDNHSLRVAEQGFI